MVAATATEPRGVEKSAAATTRHLLRSLSDPSALAQNELVSALFARGETQTQYERVRAAVLSAVEALRPGVGSPPSLALHQLRQYEIVLRYDVHGAAIAEVLRALWIAKSQFYRERAKALERIAELVRAWVAENIDARPLSDEEYRIATALQRSGNSALARTMLERLARTTAGIEKGRCLLRIAELHVDGGDVERAVHFVVSARRYGEEGEREAALLGCDASVVEAQIAWALGERARALDILRPAIAQTRALIGAGGDAAALLGRALALEANIAFHTATLEECARFVNEGCGVLDPRDDRTADTLADLLTIRTSIHTTKIGALDQAKTYDDELMTFARDRGLVRKLAVGVKDLAVIHHYRGNRDEAQLYADQALALATAVCGSKERAVATYEWAHMQAECGNRDALRSVRDTVARVRATLPRGGFWWAYSYAIDSFALLADGDAMCALDHAATALRHFQRIDSDRGIGVARALQAKGLRLLAQTREARLRAEQAVEHLQRAPQTFWLPYAQRLLEPAS